MPEEQPTSPKPESEISGSASSVNTSPDGNPIPQSDSSPTSKTDLEASKPMPPSEVPVSPIDSQSPAVQSSKADSQPSAAQSSKTDSQASTVPSKSSGEKSPSSSASEAKRRLLSKPTSENTQSSSGSGAQTTADKADSKIEAIFFQIWSVVSKTVGSIGSAVGSQFAKSSLYRNLQEKLKPLQPVFKLMGFLWTKLLVPIWNRLVKPLWGIVLKLLRSLFSDLLKPFSDRFLTLIIVGMLAILYWLFSSVTAAIQPAVGQQPMPTPVVTAPPQPATPAVPSPPATPSTPPVVKAPDLEPPLPPQPEQKQIMTVQTQVTQVFDQYSQDLIQSVQANFQAERLVIQVSDRWFELSQSEQNQLGTDALERSRKLDFPKLEIRDQQDQLLAREPVVGPNIIVLQRRTASPELLDSPAPSNPA